jgi:uncharacterized DUF497 family protein
VSARNYKWKAFVGNHSRACPANYRVCSSSTSDAKLFCCSFHFHCNYTNVLRTTRIYLTYGASREHRLHTHTHTHIQQPPFHIIDIISDRAIVHGTWMQRTGSVLYFASTKAPDRRVVHGVTIAGDDGHAENERTLVQPTNHSRSIYPRIQVSGTTYGTAIIVHVVSVAQFPVGRRQSSESRTVSGQ